MGTRATKATPAPVGARRARAAAARKPSSTRRKVKTFFAWTALFVLTPLAVAAVYLFILFVQVSKTVPSLADIGSYKPAEGTKIYYSDGSLMAVLQTENRRPKKLNEISKNLIEATVATEDSRFYEHSGVDIHGIVRAAYRNATGGEMKEGASTITQQLARNINELGLSREKKLRRKVAEAILAMRLEQTYSKNEILELYLNQINYGHGTYGAEAAAQLYFHKHAKDLDLAQASYLAGIPQRPTLYSNDRDAALKRQDWVLQRMVETGKISDEQRDQAKAEKLNIPTKFQSRASRVYGAPYVVNFVMQVLEKEFGDDAVYNGWKVYTTIHPGIQKAAEETLKYGIHHYGDSANQAALISIDPKTGYIRALVGGLDFSKNQYNIVIDGKRQPGSSFKPIVYTAAFDNDVCNLDKVYHDDPSFEGEREGNSWHPKNYGGKHWGDVSVLTALKFSINTIAVKVACETGLGTVIDYARRLGITTIDPSHDKYPPLALGAAAVRPLELCDAYCTFANNGKRALPMIFTRVVDNDGNVVKEVQPEVVDTHLKPETLSQINEALRAVVESGTGYSAHEVPDAHGKTGTTSDNRDAWFAGYTPDLVTVIWAGREHYNKKGHVDAYLTMEGTTGGHLCAPTWKDFMLRALPIQQAAMKAMRDAQAREAQQEKAISLDDHGNKRDSRKPADGVTSPAARAQQANDAKNAPGAANGPATPGAPGALTPDQPGTLPSAVPPSAPAPAPGTQPTTAAPPVTPGAQGTPAPATPNPNGPPTASAPGPSPIIASLSRSNRGTRADDSARTSEPTGRIAAPPVRRSDPRDEMVTVRLCAETMKLANGPWCPTTIERRMRRRDVPGRCRLHRAPPGEQ